MVSVPNARAQYMPHRVGDHDVAAPSGELLLSVLEPGPTVIAGLSSEPYE